MRIFAALAALAACAVIGQVGAQRAAACFYIETAEAQVADITVIAPGKTFYYRDEHIAPSDFTVAEEIERRRINAPLEEKMQLVERLIERGADCKAALGYCFPRLISAVDGIGKYVYRAPIDARAVYRDGSYYVEPETDGAALDEVSLYGSIYYCFKCFGSGREVKAYTLPLSPAVTASELKERLKLRGEYTTDFSTSTAARAHNVAHAVKKLGGIKLAPGETLSFNGAVGERTQENGFKTAKIILNGKYVDGVGGGVCQASTAVYNAALKAGLFAGANAHSICPSYTAPGLDAMISEFSDLTVVNTTASDVYFAVTAENGRATVRIYGEANEFDIVPESVVESVIPFEHIEETDVERKYFDDTAVKGDRLLVSPGKDGYKSSTYLNYYKNGELVKRVKLRENMYKATPQIIAIAP